MKYVMILVFGLSFVTGCGENKLVEVEVISVHPRVENGWYTRFSHLTVERTDTGERRLIMSDTLGNTGDVFMVRERFLTN